MSPTPSITKASILSSSPSFTSPPFPSQTSPNPSPSQPPSSPTYFPPSHPTRRLYLLARSTSVVLATTQITLASVAFTLFSRRRWLDPCLSPAITTLIYSSIEILAVLRWDARAHHYTRGVYDGLISVGFAVAMGFMVRVALPSMKGAEGGGGEGAGGLAVVVLICMISQIIIHASISVGGVRDIIRIRREKKSHNRDMELA